MQEKDAGGVSAPFSSFDDDRDGREAKQGGYEYGSSENDTAPAAKRRRSAPNRSRSRSHGGGSSRSRDRAGEDDYEFAFTDDSGDADVPRASLHSWRRRLPSPPMPMQQQQQQLPRQSEFISALQLKRRHDREHYVQQEQAEARAAPPSSATSASTSTRASTGDLNYTSHPTSNVCANIFQILSDRNFDSRLLSFFYYIYRLHAQPPATPPRPHPRFGASCSRNAAVALSRGHLQKPQKRRLSTTVRWLQAPVAVPLVPLELQLSMVNILCSPPFTRITHASSLTLLLLLYCRRHLWYCSSCRAVSRRPIRLIRRWRIVTEPALIGSTIERLASSRSRLAVVLLDDDAREREGERERKERKDNEREREKAK
jgi:hypothetical protein